MPCAHEDFLADVKVYRLRDTGRFMADVRIKCAVCGVPMRFLGLKRGLAMSGARASEDELELRVGVHPKGELLPPAKIEGYDVRKTPGAEG